MSVDNGVNG